MMGSSVQDIGAEGDARTRLRAGLLLGPTGSGKTPLGDVLALGGLGGRRCVHFDFGACLRRIAAGAFPSCGLGAREEALVRRCLSTGALLENGAFHVAEGILLSVARDERIGPEDWLIMNGLPRHAGQAAAVDRLVDLRWIVSLDCSAETVLERLARDAGGDRGERIDDEAALVRGKLATYGERTRPLLDRYRRGGVKVVHIDVTADMKACTMAALARSGLGLG